MEKWMRDESDCLAIEKVEFRFPASTQDETPNPSSSAITIEHTYSLSATT